jgi:hypothetical protein
MIDVSRDGLLLNTSRSGYWVGQSLQVTFPYWSAPIAMNVARKASVVRNLPIKGFRYAVAICFDLHNPKVSGFASASPCGQVKVLTVERDPAMVQIMRSLLESGGYDVAIVANGGQALDILKSETPDVLLADAECSSESTSGHELCRSEQDCKNRRPQYLQRSGGSWFSG